MLLNDYQDQAEIFDVYAGQMPLIHNVLKLAGEAGEVSEKVGKLMRDRNIEEFNNLPQDVKDELIKELGDVLWYVARIAGLLGTSLQDVAFTNLVKLTSRKQRGKLKGSGDNR